MSDDDAELFAFDPVEATGLPVPDPVTPGQPTEEPDEEPDPEEAPAPDLNIQAVAAENERRIRALLAEGTGYLPLALLRLRVDTLTDFIFAHAFGDNVIEAHAQLAVLIELRTVTLLDEVESHQRQARLTEGITPAAANGVRP